MALLLTWFIFVFVLGACVGSFLNVVIYRLPAGESIVSPPSSCPRCGHLLAWYDNVPVLGWLWLRGRCRYCRTPISVQYPLIEAATAILFGGWFAVCYFSGLRPDYAGPGFEATWILFAADLTLLAALLAATMIDAKYFIIPLELPWLASGAAVVLLPLAVWASPDVVRDVAVPVELTRSARLEAVRSPYGSSASVRAAVELGRPGPVEVSPAPLASGRAIPMALGGALGLALALILLRRGVIPRSFDDPAHDRPKDADPPSHAAPVTEEDDENAPPPPAPPDPPDPTDPNHWPAHPHPRREVLKECLFLAPPILLAAIAALLWNPGPVDAPLRALAGAGLGYLIGGAVVWGVRILGTLGFGKEAMGLGDVHLMAAVGAVAGWRVAVLAFFIAPFFGLGWALVSAGAARLLRREVRMIPYGPHLALAGLLVMIFHEPLMTILGLLPYVHILDILDMLLTR